MRANQIDVELVSELVSREMRQRTGYFDPRVIYQCVQDARAEALCHLCRPCLHCGLVRYIKQKGHIFLPEFLLQTHRVFMLAHAPKNAKSMGEQDFDAGVADACRYTGYYSIFHKRDSRRLLSTSNDERELQFSQAKPSILQANQRFSESGISNVEGH